MATSKEGPSPDQPPATCGAGVAQHAAIPARIAAMFEGLAETFELHRRMLVLDDPNAQREDGVYKDLGARWRQIAQQVHAAAAQMAAQRDLPMAAHDENAWGDPHLRAFQKFVLAQREVLELLQVAAANDERMLAGMLAGE
jgi:hypothetical protein